MEPPPLNPIGAGAAREPLSRPALGPAMRRGLPVGSARLLFPPLLPLQHRRPPFSTRPPRQYPSFHPPTHPTSRPPSVQILGPAAFFASAPTL